MKKLLRRLLILLVLAGLAAGGYWLYRERFAPKGDELPETFKDTAVVKRGSLEAVVEILGTLNAEQRRELNFSELIGVNQILEVRVVEGDAVAKGDIIALVNPEPYRQALEKARSDVKTAQQRLADAEKPASEAQIGAADLLVARAGQALIEARAALEALRKPDVDKLQAAVQDAADRLAAARLEQTLVQHSEGAKLIRDLKYAVDWHGRRANELKTLVAAGQANAEETLELAAEQQAEGESRSKLAAAEADRQLQLSLAAREVTEAERELAAARKALAGAQSPAASPSAQLALRRAELAIREAEVDVAAAKEARAKLDEGPEESAVRAARIDLERRRLAVGKAEAALGATELKAPFAGTIVALTVAAGDYVETEQTIAELANMERLQIATMLDETVIRDIVAGQRAEITFDSLPGVTYTAEVESVPLQGTVDQNVTYYPVTLTLQDAVDDTLRLGTVATVKIRTGRVEDGLLVPAMAVQYEEGLTFVFLPNPASPDEPEQVTVEVGVSDGTETEITDGLEEGQTVLIPLRSNMMMMQPGY